MENDCQPGESSQLPLSGTEKENKQEKLGKSSTRDGGALAGTTRRVYRYIYREGPVRPHEIQRDLKLSSSSQVDYHIQKLLQMKLIRENAGGENGSAAGYVAEEAVFEAMVRIRRTVIPLWTTVTTFFAGALLVLLTILKPSVVNGTWLFSLVITIVALSISAYQAVTSLRGNGI